MANATKQPLGLPDRPIDGVRSGINGWWIYEAEAKERTLGKEEWWKMNGFAGMTMALKQYDPKGPKERPIWMWDNGSMYLGEWKQKDPKGYPLWHGFGAFYCNSPKNKGLVYTGEWKYGKAHGSGKARWLESAPKWKKNEYTLSSSRERRTPRPFVYSGACVNSPQDASVTLNNNTIHVGPTKGEDRWKDNTIPVAAFANHQMKVKADESATGMTASTRVSLSAKVKPLPRENSTDDRRPNERPVKRAKKDRTRTTAQDYPQIISLTDCDDSDTGQGTVASSAAAVTDAAFSTREQVDNSSKEVRVERIREWLVKIGYDPNQEEMTIYARKFYDHGFHSVQMIVNVCTKEDIIGFDWINPYHKRWITAALCQY